MSSIRALGCAMMGCAVMMCAVMLPAHAQNNDASLTFNANLTFVKATRRSLLNMRSIQVQEWAMDPTSWACAEYDANRPWEAHGYLEDYRSGSNSESVNMMNVISYPLVLVKSATESNLCMLIDQKSYCYPPTPSETAITNVDTGEKTYYGRSFWGQASDARVQYHAETLKAAINNMGVRADTDTLYLSFWESLEREVRYNALE